MPDFNVRADSVNVEQIMEQIRARIREKRGVDYTEQQIRERRCESAVRFVDAKRDKILALLIRGGCDAKDQQEIACSGFLDEPESIGRVLQHELPLDAFLEFLPGRGQRTRLLEKAGGAPALPKQRLQPLWPVRLETYAFGPVREFSAEADARPLGQRQRLLHVRGCHDLQAVGLDVFDQSAICRQQA